MSDRLHHLGTAARQPAMIELAWVFLNGLTIIGLTQLLLWLSAAAPWLFEAPVHAEPVWTYTAVALTWGMFRAVVLDPVDRRRHADECARRKALAAIRQNVGSDDALLDLIAAGSDETLVLSYAERGEVISDARHLASNSERGPRRLGTGRV